MTTQITTSNISDTVIAGRRLADYRPIREFPGHFHSNDMRVGYAIRETIRGGKVLWHGDVDANGRHEHCGYDVAAVEGACRYGDTFTVRDSYRATPGGYAVVDSLYSCGCRT